MIKKDYLKTIDELLEEVGEDKFQNLSTTSFKFKTDLWNFFTNMVESQHFNALEFGTHKGQTTRILGHLFRKVWTINLPNHFYEAKMLNSDLENITYVELDLKSTPTDKIFKTDPINVFFIDAIHEFDAIMKDFARSLNFPNNEQFPIYFIWDDYGQENREVYMAVQQLIQTNKLEKVCYIGHEPNHNFGGRPPRILKEHEGIITKLVQ